MKLCMTELKFLEKTFFAPKIGEMGQKWPKIGSFEFKEIFKEIEFKLILIQFVL